MVQRLLTWLKTSGSYLWLIVLAVYFAVLAGQAIYRNYGSQQVSQALRAELKTAKLERERMAALLVYYQTDAFKEKELRRSLLLKKPDEKVYALPESSLGATQEAVAAAQVKAADPRTKLPIWRQWVEYLFGGSGAQS